jgi:hypothetical protein
MGGGTDEKNRAEAEAIAEAEAMADAIAAEKEAEPEESGTVSEPESDASAADAEAGAAPGPAALPAPDVVPEPLTARPPARRPAEKPRRPKPRPAEFEEPRPGVSALAWRSLERALGSMPGYGGYYFFWLAMLIPVLMFSSIETARVGALISSCFLIASAAIYGVISWRRDFAAGGLDPEPISDTPSACFDSFVWMMLLGFLALIVARCLMVLPALPEIGLARAGVEVVASVPVLGDLFLASIPDPSLVSFGEMPVSGFLPFFGDQEAILGLANQLRHPAWPDGFALLSGPAEIGWTVLAALAVTYALLRLSMVLPAAALGRRWISAFESWQLTSGSGLKLLAAFAAVMLPCVLFCGAVLVIAAEILLKEVIISRFGFAADSTLVYGLGLFLVVGLGTLLWHVASAFLFEAFIALDGVEQSHRRRR